MSDNQGKEVAASRAFHALCPAWFVSRAKPAAKEILQRIFPLWLRESLAVVISPPGMSTHAGAQDRKSREWGIGTLFAKSSSPSRSIALASCSSQFKRARLRG